MPDSAHYAFTFFLNARGRIRLERRRGKDDQARKLVVEELEHARRWGVARGIGIALRALALIELGAALRRMNERTEARELLRRGVELAHGCGATALVERANEELVATGARPHKILLTGLESLTASVRRVAQLAAEELSNKEIAQALFVTMKTVDVHLSSV